jgi:biopolymer transport protein ExbD
MRKPVIPDMPCMVRINVTPIIDVALVLVIILLVTAPIFSVADLDIELPSAQTRGAEDDRRISVSYSANGELAVDDELVSLGTMAAAIRSRLDEWGDERTLVVVRAHAAATHGHIRELMREIKGSGAQRIAVATTQTGKDES